MIKGENIKAECPGDRMMHDNPFRLGDIQMQHPTILDILLATEETCEVVVVVVQVAAVVVGLPCHLPQHDWCYVSLGHFRPANRQP